MIGFRDASSKPQLQTSIIDLWQGFQSVSVSVVQRAVVLGNEVRGIVALSNAKLVHCAPPEQHFPFKPSEGVLHIARLGTEGWPIFPGFERVFYSLFGSRHFFCGSLSGPNGRGLYCCEDGINPFAEVRATCLGFVTGWLTWLGSQTPVMVRELHVWGVRKRDSMVRKRSGGSQTSFGKFGFAKVRLRQCAGSIVYIPLPLCLHFSSGRNENVLCLAVLVRQA